MPNARHHLDLFARLHVGGIIGLADYMHAVKKKTPTEVSV